MYWSRFISARAVLWRSLRNCSPHDVCRRALAELREGGFMIRFLNREYRVDPAAGRIGGPEADPLLEDQELELLLLTYLTRARETPLVGEWISEKDLPGGSTFFRGPHALPVQPLLKRFGRDSASFRRACTSLGGKPIGYGDAAFRFQALPRIPMACLLWLEDEEFPARSTFMFDRSLALHLPLDVVLALVHCLGARLLEAAGPPGV